MVSSAYERGSGISRGVNRKERCIFSILKCWCLVCSERRDRATAAWLQRAGQVGDELERTKQGTLWDKLGRIDSEEDIAWAVEAEENFLMKHSCQKDKVVSDTAKLIFMALKNIFEKTFAKGRLRYEVDFFKWL